MYTTSNYDDNFLNNLNLIDNELSIRFKGLFVESDTIDKINVYRFLMIHSQTKEIIGEVSIKHAYTENIINYRGNIGFKVFEKFRGKKYSSRSCILLKPVLKYLSINPVWITCNIYNLSSKKNIELLGAKFFDKVIINDDSPFAQYYAEDSRIKLRYKWEIE